MQLHISKETEAAIQARAAAAGFGTTEEYILDLIETDMPAESPPEESRAEWLKRFDAFVARQRSTNPHFDDSRESIYQDR